MKWTFEDVDTAEVYTLVRNPYEMATPTGPRRTQGLPRGLALRGGSIPFAWSFRGRLATEEEYDTMLDWSRRRRIRITDHLGRIHLITPQAFEPTPRRDRIDKHWRYLYVFKGLYLGREA